jgi:predicted nucleotidyltransferase
MIARTELDAMEVEGHALLPGLKAFVDEASKRFPVKAALLFGSRARGDHRPDSDVDVAIILPGSRKDYYDTKMDLTDIAFDNMLKTGVLVQAWPFWEAELKEPDKHPNPEIIGNIMREGIRISYPQLLE